MNDEEPGKKLPLDTYVTSFRHALIEADKGSKESQLGALRKIGLPITAIIDTAGKSIHGWVRIDASTREEYRKRVALLHEFCRESLGLEVDPQNTNPSRYSRMPNGNRMRVNKETGEQFSAQTESLSSTNSDYSRSTFQENHGTSGKRMFERRQRMPRTRKLSRSKSC